VGIDIGYVMQGDFVLKIDGKPAGDSYETLPQTPHDACSISGNKLIDTFVIEKGKPLASPVKRTSFDVTAMSANANSASPARMVRRSGS
jgi:hypothetical protein